MFENTSQLHAAMKEILEVFRQGKDIDCLYPKYPDKLALDLVEAINACVSAGYLTGVVCNVGAQDDIVISVPAPHVTTAGSEFISEN